MRRRDFNRVLAGSLAFPTLISPASAEVTAIRFGKQSFYGQIDRPLETAYGVASKAMACNMLLEDAAEGIDAFLQKRPASWRGK